MTFRDFPAPRSRHYWMTKQTTPEPASCHRYRGTWHQSSITLPSRVFCTQVFKTWMLRLGVTSTGKAFFALVLIVVSVGFYAFNRNPTILRTPPAPDIEVVMSSYREDPLAISLQINRLRQLLEAHGWSSRFILYSKDESPGFNQTKTMQEVGADELLMLRNRGREGGTL